eukprot:CFRG3172T1
MFSLALARASSSLAFSLPTSMSSLSAVASQVTYRMYSSPLDERAFDVGMLDYLACPLTKSKLRYDAVNNELISDEINVAFPIIDGIPNLVPLDGRLLHKEGEDTPKPSE